MRDPFFIDGPACISFSGGRSSGYMLWRILEAHGGTLPEDVRVVFANTGKEMPQTLDFVQECSDRWNVAITWLEYAEADVPAERWKIVDHATAARNGEPFSAVIRCKKYLPNPTTRFCTSELKVKAMHRYLVANYGWDAWTSVLGIRADEPLRVARISAPNRDRDERFAPLAVAGISARDVGVFWLAQPFDLRLPNMNGKTMHGNCDLCFLKGSQQTMSLIREKPELATWWALQESSVASTGKWSGDGARFRKDRPSYAAMRDNVARQVDLVGFEAGASCFCGD
jgi:3'-phosphoadenosine 5'-phosphosulfate sulfotransferase (PAPS reductase)/FAD synthetase